MRGLIRAMVLQIGVLMLSVTALVSEDVGRKIFLYRADP